MDGDEDSDSEEEESYEAAEEAGDQQLPFEPVLVDGDAGAAVGYEQVDVGGDLGNIDACAGDALRDMQAVAGGAASNVQAIAGAGVGNTQAFAGVAIGSVQADAGDADGYVQLIAGAVAGNFQAIVGVGVGNIQAYVEPDAHHAAANRNLQAEIDDMRNTMSILHENQTSLIHVEQEWDALREEVAVLHKKIRVLKSKSHSGVEAMDYDNPDIDMEKLPKVDGKIHIPSSLSDDDAFAVSC
ncbi:unnamed protein product [Closterium sp. Yama58-4]|nr:unnamed protein product [Closterium sp. Yama58-4]